MAIMKVLENNREHPSVEEIHIEVRESFPTMSLATVYNTLEMLRRQGEVRRLSIDPARRRYDPDTSAHHHLLCTECGRIVDIDRSFDLDLGDGEREGFEITGNHVEFTGRCPECRKKEVVTLADPACGASGTMEKQG
jgi:Fur family peroxide stress response transcriptional regulator